MADAPSEIWLELAAVTTPFPCGRKTVGSDVIFAGSIRSRIPSSRFEFKRLAFRIEPGHRQRAPDSQPAAAAALARRWLSAANVSTSSREIFQRSATALGTLPLVNQLVPLEEGRIEFLVPAADVAEHGDAGHALDAGPDGVVHVARGDRLGGKVDRLLARAAHAVERDGRHGHGKAGQQDAEPADVGPLLAGLRDGPGDDVLDLRRIDPGPLHQSGERLAQQGIGPHFTKRPASPPKRRPRHFQNDSFSHDFSPLRTTWIRNA